jgi:hypothetical protein
MTKYKIRLTKEELKTLYMVCNHIKGPIFSSRRQHFFRFEHEIRKHVNFNKSPNIISGSIYFKKFYKDFVSSSTSLYKYKHDTTKTI